MDNDKFRSSDRRVVNASGAGRSSNSTYRSEEPRYVAPSSRSQDTLPPVDGDQRHTSKNRDARRRSSRTVWPWGVISLLAVAMGAGVWLYMHFSQDEKSGIDTGKYQAIFLTNGEHYFGKLERQNSEYYKLSDVYYLKQKDTASDDGTAKQTDQTEFELRKLEKEIHGSSNTMFISDKQVLFYENLTDDSRVVQTIGQYVQQPK